ncbi:MAG: hypothetical protein LBK75_02980 [Oscillospiraceae bacterium]|jgi:hypothetical protein|nr:hypothetical protein [Oscillospiraceae bacterium]
MKRIMISVMAAAMLFGLTTGVPSVKASPTIGQAVYERYLKRVDSIVDIINDLGGDTDADNLAYNKDFPPSSVKPAASTNDDGDLTVDSSSAGVTIANSDPALLAFAEKLVDELFGDSGLSAEERNQLIMDTYEKYDTQNLETPGIYNEDTAVDDLTASANNTPITEEDERVAREVALKYYSIMPFSDDIESLVRMENLKKYKAYIPKGEKEAIIVFETTISSMDPARGIILIKSSDGIWEVVNEGY